MCITPPTLPAMAPISQAPPLAGLTRDSRNCLARRGRELFNLPADSVFDEDTGASSRYVQFVGAMRKLSAMSGALSALRRHGVPLAGIRLTNLLVQVAWGAVSLP